MTKLETTVMTRLGKIVATDGKWIATWGAAGNLESEVKIKEPQQQIKIASDKLLNLIGS